MNVPLLYFFSETDEDRMTAPWKFAEALNSTHCKIILFGVFQERWRECQNLLGINVISAIAIGLFKLMFRCGFKNLH